MDDQRPAVREAYDEIAVDHDAARRSAPAPEQSMVVDLVESLPDDACVLDAGCGAGDPIAATMAEHVSVVGVDFSRGQLRLAADKVANADFVQGDVTALPFAGNSFDALVSFFTIIHVPWEKQLDCVREFQRVLKPSAPVLLTVGTSDWEGTQEDWMGFGEEMHWTMPGPERAVGLLEESGFSVQGQATYNDPISEEAGEMTVIQARA